MSVIDVTVITPTFRRENLLVETIDSVMKQEGVRVEMIVLDDSPEGSAEQAVRGLGHSRIRYVKQATPSGGRPAIVRNQGAQLATGRFLYFLDDDDHVMPGALAGLVAALDSRKHLGVAFGHVVPFGDNPDALQEKSAYFQRAAAVARRANSLRAVATILFRGTLYVNSACMIRRECFAPLGGYDPSIPVYEDVEFYMRAIRQYGHVFVDIPVLHYRTGAPSLMFNLSDQQPVVDSYKIMHEKYLRARGPVEFYGLKAWAKVLPSPVPQ